MHQKKTGGLNLGRLRIVVIIFGLFIIVKPTHAEEVTQKYKGLTINANLELAQGKTLQDGVVLILHALLAHNRMEVIETAQQALLENGQSSLGINLSLNIDNRHGFYDCSWPHYHLESDAVDEISAWVAWLRERSAKRISLMAHSRGANQAMVYAVEKRDPEVRSLVLLAPFTTDNSTQMLVGRYGTNINEIMRTSKALIKTGNGDQLMDKTDFMFCPQSQVTAHAFVSYYDNESRFRNFPSYLPKVDIPTLITAGTDDERQPDIAKQVSPFVDGKHIQLVEIEGAGHFFRDFNIDEAMEAAIEFIADSW